MWELENLLDEQILRSNVEFATLFVLNYESLKEFVIEKLISFYANSIEFKEGKITYERSDSYKKQVRSLDKKSDIASMKWFLKAGAITETELDIYNKCKIRRDDITHELLKNLSLGFQEKDMDLFINMVCLYQKIDNWWINEIEIPTSADEIPENYDRNEVVGGQVIILSAINDIMLGNGSTKYNEILDLLRKMKEKKSNGQECN